MIIHRPAAGHGEDRPPLHKAGGWPSAGRPRRGCGVLRDEAHRFAGLLSWPGRAALSRRALAGGELAAASSASGTAGGGGGDR